MTNNATTDVRIRESDIAQVRERNPIDEVIGEYVALQRAGGAALKGLCPFHDEKTPSLNVRPSNGTFHCFGCGAGGDVIGFMMQFDRLTFVEAVERLAKRAGTALAYETYRDGPATVKRPDIPIAGIVSSGPMEIPQPDSSVYTKASPCCVCLKPILAGEHIAKLGTPRNGQAWAHRTCAQDAIDEVSIRNAWALIGADVARRPRAYSSKQVRTVVENLVELVWRDEFELDD